MFTLQLSPPPILNHHTPLNCRPHSHSLNSRPHPHSLICHRSNWTSNWTCHIHCCIVLCTCHTLVVQQVYAFLGRCVMVFPSVYKCLYLHCSLSLSCVKIIGRDYYSHAIVTLPFPQLSHSIPQLSHSHSLNSHTHNCHTPIPSTVTLPSPSHLHHHTLTISHPHPSLYTLPDGGIIWSSNDDSVIILQAPHPVSVTPQHCGAAERLAVPDLWWVKGEVMCRNYRLHLSRLHGSVLLLRRRKLFISLCIHSYGIRCYLGSRTLLITL